MMIGQTHPSQLGKLFEALEEGYDLVYGYYPDKKHNWFRNLGSRFNDLTVNAMIRKPKNVRTSSYFVARKFIRDYAIQYTGSYTYLLGLFMRCTQNIASVRSSILNGKWESPIIPSDSFYGSGPVSSDFR